MNSSFSHTVLELFTYGLNRHTIERPAACGPVRETGAASRYTPILRPNITRRDLQERQHVALQSATLFGLFAVSSSYSTYALLYDEEQAEPCLQYHALIPETSHPRWKMTSIKNPTMSASRIVEIGVMRRAMQSASAVMAPTARASTKSLECI